MLLPTPLYESLPALYVSGGVATVATLDSFVAILSGLTLGFAGILIYSLRRSYRQRPRYSRR